MSAGIHQLSSIPRFTTSDLNFSTFNPQFSISHQHVAAAKPYSRSQSTSVIKCVAPRAKKNSGPKTVNQEAMELVRLVLRNITDQQPLVTTLNKYVRMLRVEHCFLMFEELGRSDKWLQCLEVFKWMQKQRWYIADNGVYSKLISVMGRKGQTRMAMWLFSEMRNSGCRADTSVYNSLITAHLHTRDKSKALEKAMGYFNKMKGIERCKPNVVTYNILLRAYAHAKNIEQVNTLFKDLEESLITPDIFTFNGVMDAYGKNGMIQEMETTLTRMKSNQCKPDGITFNLLIDAYGKKQEFDKMDQVFKSFMRTKHKPTAPTFNSMITNYGRARLREKAELTYQKMKNMGVAPTYVTHDCMITMYGYCDYVSRARDIFDEMVSSSGGREVKVSTLNAMLDAYCRNGLASEADVLFETMRNLGINRDSTTYKLLYRAYTKGNEKELLQKLMKQMDKDGIVPNKRFFLEALGAFGSSGRSKNGSSKGRMRTDSVKPRTAAAT